MSKICCLYKHRHSGELLTLCRSSEPAPVLDGHDGDWRLVDSWPVDEIAECQLFRPQPELETLVAQFVGLLRAELERVTGASPPQQAFISSPAASRTLETVRVTDQREALSLDDRPSEGPHDAASSRQLRILERHRQRILLFEVITKRSHLDPSITLSRLMTDWEQWTPVAASANWHVGRNATRRDGTQWRVAVRGLPARYAEFETQPSESQIDAVLADLDAPNAPPSSPQDGWQASELWLDWVIWRHKESGAHRLEPFYQAQWHRPHLS